MTRNTKWALAGLASVLAVVFGLLLFAAGGNNKKAAGIVDNTVCEFCGKKLPKSGLCPSCIAQMGLESYQAKRESKYWYNSPLIANIIVSLLCVLAVTYIGVTLRTFSKRKKVEVTYNTRCKKCGRKLRYRDSQIDHVGRCPLCHHPMRFPKPTPITKSSVWSKVRGLSWRKIRQIVWD